MFEELLAEITWAGSGIAGRAELLDALIDALGRLIPCDGVTWSRVDFANRTVTAHGEPFGSLAAPPGAELIDLIGDNPMMRSYWADVMTRRQDRPPRRMSDVTTPREYHRTTTYTSVLHPLGAESQLTILTHQTGLLSGTTWIFSRPEDHDFTADEVALATRLQPVLALIQSTGALDDEERGLTDAGILASVTALPQRSAQPHDDFDLTGRELQVLSLLAHGLTAAAIGRYLRISDRTVRKHLENSYRKLHCSDRLVAVDRARAAGLLPKLPLGSPAAALRS
ncbi:helix-turn-helix transcriptional regulator [Gryllotalpicola koreensis]|uniref:HTH luxR-type domain-containing protein n=1 Tax=Gryllotalpicola koreensis TaxID=993086 RepID=A0ABP8A2S7_9MICO